MPNVRKSFPTRAAQGRTGLSCEVIGLSGQEMSDRPSVMLLENFLPHSCPLAILWGQETLGAGHTSREPGGLSLWSLLVWGASGKHTIISGGPIKWSAGTETDYKAGGYFVQMAVEGLSQERTFELRPKWGSRLDLSLIWSKIRREPYFTSSTKVKSEWIK